MSKRVSFDGVSPLSETPTTSSGLSSTFDNSKEMEDINYLLYLEALKRFKDDEANVRRQVEEKAKQYEIAKAEYRSVYERYIRLYKAAATRTALEQKRNLSEDQMASSERDIALIIKRLNNDKTTANFDMHSLKQCLDYLRAENNFNKVEEMETKISSQKTSVKAIHDFTESLQLKLESAMTKTLDYFVELAQNKQMETILSDSQDETLE